MVFEFFLIAPINFMGSNNDNNRAKNVQAIGDSPLYMIPWLYPTYATYQASCMTDLNKLKEIKFNLAVNSLSSAIACGAMAPLVKFQSRYMLYIYSHFMLALAGTMFLDAKIKTLAKK